MHLARFSRPPLGRCGRPVRSRTAVPIGVELRFIEPDEIHLEFASRPADLTTEDDDRPERLRRPWLWSGSELRVAKDLNAVTRREVRGHTATLTSFVRAPVRGSGSAGPSRVARTSSA